ncbi:unnamed protein product [Hermetia illucens]|uniref:Ionotropic receptor n=1 Tax=Hermetia illucens TaxID=343691 RepID=A0A7R8UA60_HERIL|nr:unnamed protein product [Hermetia illucens]
MMKTTTIVIIFCSTVFPENAHCNNIVEQCLEQSPMFVLFSTDEYGRKGAELLNVASHTILRPRIIISNSTFGRILPYVNKNLISFVIVTNKSVDSVLETVRISLRRLHESRIIFLLDFDPSTEFIEMLANWCWTHRMINVVISIEDASNRTTNKKLYSFSPFPTLTIEKLPEGSVFEDLFPNKVGDLKGYPIRTVLKYDHPRSFTYTNYKSEMAFGGYLSKTFYTWITTHNASIQVIDDGHRDILNRPQIMNFLQNNTIDLAPHVLGLNVENMDSTSAILFGTVCIIVPQSSPIAPHNYLLLPFDRGVWYLILCIVIYVTFIECICGLLVYGRLDIGDAFCNLLLCIMYQSLERRSFKYRPFVAIHGQLMLLGFILTNLFLGLLSSFLTVVVYERQSNTFEDIDKSGVKLMLEKDEFDYFVAFGIILAKFKHLFIFLSHEELMEQLRTLNDSYGYMIPSDKYEMIHFIEKPLRRKIFHKTAIDSFGASSGMTIRDDAFFLDSFNKHITRTFDGGLNAKWINDIGRESIEVGIVKATPTPQASYVLINGKHLQLGLYCLVGGLTLSLFCFLLEFVHCKATMRTAKRCKDCFRQAMKNWLR